VSKAGHRYCRACHVRNEAERRGRLKQAVVGVVASLLLCLSPILAIAYDDIKNVKFVKAYDGGTITIELQDMPSIFERMEVRLRGIDAPDIHGKCDREKFIAQAAKEFVVGKLETAKRIDLTKVQRDKYFRINAYVIADGVNLSEREKELKLAVEYWGHGPKQDWCK
jgi:endonuclease YncB( thermonuclease family)